MLVYPELELSRQDFPGNFIEPCLKLTNGWLDSDCISEPVVKELFETLHWLLTNRWNWGALNYQAERVTFLQDKWSEFGRLDAQSWPLDILSRPWRIHLLPGTEDVETVRLSIQALIGGCPTLDLDSFGNHVHGKCKKDYWNCASSYNNLLKVLPIQCYRPRRDSQTECFIIIQDKVCALTGDIVPVQCSLYQLVFYGPTGIPQVKP